ncbi:MAG: quinone-dependent dihydroorotate dehydrogenase [Cyclobacteriaceae bacterium]|jgi:dihydroorotate dehydrogenase|nr:quinone-dependent dihydroorotate dehydrogenase [Cyclobacteriaceae bacterium]
MYQSFIRPLLFGVDPEKIHHATFRLLQVLQHVPGALAVIRKRYAVGHPALQRTVFGITFPNPVGLAAGFDKDAKAIDALAAFGFGFIEIGTLTPKPQPGNDKPRLFRLTADRALINRMGFNNEGVEAAVARLRGRKSPVIVGGNIGKNKTTPNEKAFEDYNFCFEALYPQVDYFVVNVSSPNTPGLRELQEKEPLKNLLAHVKSLSENKPKAKPILLKIAPDLTTSQLDDIVEILKTTKTDGVIATNTTISRNGLTTPAARVDALGNGGLSGAPLSDQSNEVIRYLRARLGPGYPIIGVGGIMSATDALEKIKAGADLIQLYTGFVYEGPGFVKEINRALIP